MLARRNSKNLPITVLHKCVWVTFSLVKNENASSFFVSDTTGGLLPEPGMRCHTEVVREVGVFFPEVRVSLFSLYIIACNHQKYKRIWNL